VWSQSQGDTVYDGPLLTTVGQFGLLLSVRKMKTLQRHKLSLFGGILRPARSITLAAVEGYHPYFPCDGFYPFEAKLVPRGEAGSRGAQVPG
jgi:hypothetical protein